MNKPARTLSRFEDEIVLKIARRAAHVFERFDRPVTYWYMDIENCHTKAIELDLNALLAADEGTFGHDVGGIYAHLDRKTGQLLDCFVPRTALNQ
jgi:hypothetical protein